MRKILINMSKLGKNGTGMYVYSISVLKALINYKNNIRIIVSAGVKIDNEYGEIELPSFISNTAKISFFKPILYYLYLKFIKFDADYCISTTHHRISNVAHNIITLHDVRPYYLPDSIIQKIYFHYILPKELNKCDGIITVSNSAKKAIIETYKILPYKIKVVYNYIDTNYFKYENSLLNKEKYILLVGATWKHKNAHELIKFNEIWKNKYRLKIVCGNSKYSILLKQLVYKNGIEEYVDFYHNISLNELKELYCNAQALVYPSLMEGFGIPPLEAMACGTPAIVSDIDVFREVYSDAAIYVKLGNYTSWCDSFSLLESNYDMYVQRGLIKSKEYTLERMENSIKKAIYEIWGL